MEQTLTHRVVARYRAANATHYRYDAAKVEHILQRKNDPALREESKLHDGGYFEYTFELVPTTNIHIQPVWHPQREQALLKALEDGLSLPPILLAAPEHGDGKYAIDDGIHRLNVSIQRGYTHVPALIFRWVATPEAKAPVIPEKPQLADGAWVKLHKAWHEPSGTYEYGYVAERLGPLHEQGVRRWRYQIALVVPKSTYPEYIDVRDTDFEPAHAPAWGRKLS